MDYMLLGSSALGNFASMICGDSPYKYFPYRLSSQLTAFFHYLNLDYPHDGSTRKLWVESVLIELNNFGDSASPLPSNQLSSISNIFYILKISLRFGMILGSVPSRR